MIFSIKFAFFNLKLTLTLLLTFFNFNIDFFANVHFIPKSRLIYESFKNGFA